VADVVSCKLGVFSMTFLSNVSTVEGFCRRKENSPDTEKTIWYYNNGDQIEELISIILQQEGIENK
jgi:hypothetical protein